MSHQANDDRGTAPSSTVGEPDAYGQAALILTEALIHALIETKTITAERALEIVHSAAEIKTEVASQSGESKTRLNESLELLKRIGISLEKDVH